MWSETSVTFQTTEVVQPHCLRVVCIFAESIQNVVIRCFQRRTNAEAETTIAVKMRCAPTPTEVMRAPANKATVGTAIPANVRTF